MREALDQGRVDHVPALAEDLKATAMWIGEHSGEGLPG